MTTMTITLNGESRNVEPGTTVAALIEQLGLPRSQVATERNRAILPRAQYAQTLLEEGDVLEVVTFVGGG